MQSDSSSRFLMANADLRGYLLQLNETYADSLSATDYPLPIRILLGEFLAAAALLSETIKFKGRLSTRDLTGDHNIMSKHRGAIQINWLTGTWGVLGCG